MDKLPSNMMIPYDLAMKLQIALSAEDFGNPVLQEYINYVLQKKKSLLERMAYDHGKPSATHDKV